jgi:ABC-type transporter Mla maintaining outer membrane lipid asymmetry ATPase subunit MlaF
MADRIIFLVGGRAIAGTPQDLLRSTDQRVVEFLQADSDGPLPAPPMAAAAAAAGRA